MILSQLLTQVNAAYRGSDDDAPTTGTDFTLWTNTTNRKIAEWARDSKHTWSSLWSIQSLTPVVAAGTQSYNLPLTVVMPSDKITITKTDGNTVDYTLVKPEERYQYTNAVYITGNLPQVLTFVDPIATGNAIIGGTIKVAGYYLPADLTTGTDVIPVIDPYWLVYAVASELAFNDQQYSDKAADLNSKAGNLYSMMISNNRRGTYNNPRIVPTKVSRILSPSSESGVGSL